MLRVRPVARVTPELRAELSRYKSELLLLLRCCDPQVAARRDVMRAQVERASAATLPALLFRQDVPYTAGLCFSCGDGLKPFGYGRCWRCALAWRLAVRAPIPVDLAHALDGARLA